MVISVSPNDTPKVIGLRQETGPCQEPPVTSSTPRWEQAAGDQRGADRVAGPLHRTDRCRGAHLRHVLAP